MKIHPVSRLSVLSAAAPVTPPSAPAAPTGCHPRTLSGNGYEPGEFCSAAEHGETRVAGDGKTMTCLARGSYWRWRIDDPGRASFVVRRWVNKRSGSSGSGTWMSRFEL
jgi:hypothetical protein